MSDLDEALDFGFNLGFAGGIVATVVAEWLTSLIVPGTPNVGGILAIAGALIAREVWRGWRRTHR